MKHTLDDLKQELTEKTCSYIFDNLTGKERADLNYENDTLSSVIKILNTNDEIDSLRCELKELIRTQKELTKELKKLLNK